MSNHETTSRGAGIKVCFPFKTQLTQKRIEEKIKIYLCGETTTISTNSLIYELWFFLLWLFSPLFNNCTSTDITAMICSEQKCYLFEKSDKPRVAFQVLKCIRVYPWHLLLRLVYTYRTDSSVFVSGTFDNLNVMCKQHLRTAVNSFLNGTKKKRRL